MPHYITVIYFLNKFDRTFVNLSLFKVQHIVTDHLKRSKTKITEFYQHSLKSYFKTKNLYF